MLASQLFWMYSNRFSAVSTTLIAFHMLAFIAWKSRWSQWWKRKEALKSNSRWLRWPKLVGDCCHEYGDGVRQIWIDTYGVKLRCGSKVKKDCFVPRIKSSCNSSRNYVVVSRSGGNMSFLWVLHWTNMTLQVSGELQDPPSQSFKMFLCPLPSNVCQKCPPKSP